MSGEKDDAMKASQDVALDSARHLAPRMYLVIANISKRANVRSLLVTAAAFGCVGVFVVGQRSFDFSKDLPGQIKSHIQDGSMTITRFEKWHECVHHLKSENIQLVGVEIHEQAQNIEEFIANRPLAADAVAFLMGNEGQGLQPKQVESCDAFVVISQYGGGTASLNVNVAASIVLHRFYTYQQGIRGGQGRRMTDDAAKSLSFAAHQQRIRLGS